MSSCDPLMVRKLGVSMNTANLRLPRFWFSRHSSSSHTLINGFAIRLKIKTVDILKENTIRAFCWNFWFRFLTWDVPKKRNKYNHSSYKNNLCYYFKFFVDLSIRCFSSNWFFMLHGLINFVHSWVCALVKTLYNKVRKHLFRTCMVDARAASSIFVRKEGLSFG